MGEKMANFVHKMSLKKSSKNRRKKRRRKKILRNESKTNIMDILSDLTPNQRPDFQNSFS